MTLSDSPPSPRRARYVSVLVISALVISIMGATQLAPPSPVTATTIRTHQRLAVGFSHGCAVTPTGGVECWGENRVAQLGDGTTISSSTPVAVVLPTGWHAVAVALGENHTCALLADGQVACWGFDAVGALGAGAGIQGPAPVLVSLPTNRSALGIAAGENHTCAVLDNGEVVCWGAENNGELGQGTTFAVHDTPLTVLMPNATAAVAISVSRTHSCALLATGSITCWGSNQYGQFGTGVTSSASATPSTPVSLAGGEPATRLTVGENVTCAVSHRGLVNCWGRNNLSQLGDGTSTDRWTPTVISLPAGDTAVQVTAGSNHVCARSSVGSVTCWGVNEYGQLGVTTGGVLQSTPGAAVSLPSGDAATQVVTGFHTTCARLATGNITCWGRNHTGQVGDGTTVDRFAPSGLQSTHGDTRAVAVAAGGLHSCLLNSAGQVWCWGDNSVGQLGRGTTSEHELNIAEPVALPSPGRATAITAGTYHTCALLMDGQVSCWGSNSSGQLGVGMWSPGDRSTPSAPIVLQGSGRAKAITAGGRHSCALHTDGSIACWGDNVYGQLGDGGTTNQYATHDIIGLPGGVRAVSVDTGLEHTCALQANGDMTCWGRNNVGQLGDTTTTNRTGAVTVSVAPGTHATAIATGRNHTCALYGAGTVSCWGSNQWGQLGVDPAATSVDVGGSFIVARTAPSGTLSLPGGPPTQAVELAVGDSHTCVLLDDGTAACWGYNGNGELGDGTTTNRFTPAAVSAAPNALLMRTVSPGFNHNCAVLENGSLSCWGKNFRGALATGDRTNRLSPQRSALPPGPTALTGVTASAGVTLTWSEPTSPYQPQSWLVDGSTDGTTWWAATVSAISPSGTTVSGLTNGVPYLFRVRSITPLNTNTAQLAAYVTPVAAVPGTCEGAPDAVFLWGDGSPGNPFIVTNSAQLEAMRLPACLSRHFVQHAGITIPEGTPWHSIGTVAAPFTGSYDGDGLGIWNVSIGAAAPGVGFFGALSGATVTNVFLYGVTIVATAGSPSWDGRVGALAGEVAGSTISGITVRNAVISASGEQVGGLIGRIRVNSPADTQVMRSRANATLTGAGSVGGLIGAISSSSSGNVTVSASFSAGIAAGDQDIGGLIGYILRGSTGAVTVENSYSTATAHAGTMFAGGLIGGVNPQSAGGVTISRSYSLGSVSAPGHKGGLIGHLYPNDLTWMVVTESFWDVTTSAQTTSVGGTGMTTQGMKTLQTYAAANWSIVSGSSGGAVWGQCQGHYPVHMWQFQLDVPPCPVPDQPVSPSTPPAPPTPWSTDLTDQPTLSPDDAGSPSLPTAAQIAALPLRTFVDPAALYPGATVNFAVDGFGAGDDVMVVVASTPQLLNMARVDANGTAHVNVVVPAGLGLGVHTLAVWAPQSGTGFRQLFEIRHTTPTVDDEIVTPPWPGGALPSTGQNPWGIVVAAWALCVLGWAMARRWKRELAHDHSR